MALFLPDAERAWRDGSSRRSGRVRRRARSARKFLAASREWREWCGRALALGRCDKRGMIQLPVSTCAARACRRAWPSRGMAVLQAPPGAGKTTLVPLDLLARGLVAGRILMLEPRRLAARAVGRADGRDAGRGGGADGRLPHPGRGEGVGGHADRGGDRGHPDPDDPVGPGAVGRRAGDLRRVSRAVAECRSWAGAVPGGAGRAARGSEAAGDVGHAGRGAGGGADGRGAGGDLGRAGLSGRDAAGCRARRMPSMRLEAAMAGRCGRRWRRPEGGVLVFLPGEGGNPAGRGAAGAVCRGWRCGRCSARWTLRRSGRPWRAGRGAEGGAGDLDRRDLADPAGYPGGGGCRPGAAGAVRSRTRACRGW